MNGPDPLDPLRRHPAYAIADQLAEFTGVEKDLVQFAEFLSLAAGKMVMPVNIDVQTDRVAVDLHLANKILDIRHAHVARVDTHREFRTLERSEFLLKIPTDVSYSNAPKIDPRPVAVVLVRGNHRLLHREVSEYTARLIGTDFTLPSIWRVSDLVSTLPPVPSTLRVQTTQTYRGLDDFGFAFASHRRLTVEEDLAELIEGLPIQPHCPCSFRVLFRGTAQPEMMLVFERLLAVVATLRTKLPGATDKRPEILPADYSAVRSLLISLPLIPLDRDVTPQALVTATALFDAVQASGKQLELPDRSQHGEKWFTRQDAVRWIDVGYNTAKKHLRELEAEGIVVSDIVENNRERGRQIHFRFANDRKPPFEWQNPFESLRDLEALEGAV